MLVLVKDAVPTRSAAWRDAAKQLATAGISSPLLDARLLLQHALSITYETLMQQENKALGEKELYFFNQLVTRRLQHEPISQILGCKEFWGLDFTVTRDTLTPRPDSETLIEAALSAVNGDSERKVLDLGTGTGCLLLALLKEWTLSSGFGADISPAALHVAKQNAARHGMESRAHFVLSNWGTAINGEFDVIISNPPYIASNDMETLPREVKDFEPHLALAAGEDGMDAYRMLAHETARLLAPKGKAFFEIGAGQQEAVSGLLRAGGFNIIAITPDLASIPRCIAAQK